jgi:hypothetical protein
MFVAGRRRSGQQNIAGGHGGDSITIGVRFSVAVVDAQGTATLEFLDEKGAIIHRLPAPARDTGTQKSKS